MRPNCRGPTRRTMADRIVAMKQAVPDAVSQFKVKTAAYGASLGVTGGMRRMRLWSPGTRIPFITVGLRHDAGRSALVRASIAFLIVGWPASSTQTTSRRYGDQARKISPPEC